MFKILLLLIISVNIIANDNTKNLQELQDTLEQINKSITTDNVNKKDINKVIKDQRYLKALHQLYKEEFYFDIKNIKEYIRLSIKKIATAKRQMKRSETIKIIKQSSIGEEKFFIINDVEYQSILEKIQNKRRIQNEITLYILELRKYLELQTSKQALKYRKQIDEVYIKTNNIIKKIYKVNNIKTNTRVKLLSVSLSQLENINKVHINKEYITLYE